MKHLYELTEEMESLMDSEECDETALTRVFGDIRAKAQNICQFITVLQSEADMFKAEADRLTAHAKARKSKADQIKDYLRMNMERLDIPEIKAGTFKINLQDSPPALKCDDEKETPDGYIDIIPEQRVPAKDRIKAAIIAGKTVSGWRVERGKHVRIR